MNSLLDESVSGTKNLSISVPRINPIISKMAYNIIIHINYFIKKLFERMYFLVRRFRLSYCSDPGIQANMTHPNRLNPR